MAGPFKRFNPNPGFKSRLRPGLQVPQFQDPEMSELQQFLGVLAEFVEQGDGNRGQPEQRFVTAQDLKDAGIADIVVKNRRAEIGSSSEQAKAVTTAARSAVSGALQSFAELTDTTIVAPTDQQVAKYIAGTGKWENRELLADITHIDFIPQATPPSPWTEGRVYYDSYLESFAYETDQSIGQVQVAMGQDIVVRVFNDSGAQINKGQAVYVTGEAGGVMTVDLAQADAVATSKVLGLARHDMTVDGGGIGQPGWVIRQGTLDFDTNAFTNADQLYLSPITPGLLTATRPVDATQFVVPIGIVKEKEVGGGADGRFYVQLGQDIEARNSTMYSGTIKRVQADPSGVLTLFSDTSTETEVRKLVGAFQDGTVQWELGNTMTNDDLYLTNSNIGGWTFIQNTSAGPTTETMIRLIPGGATQIGGEGQTFLLGSVEEAVTIGRIDNAGPTEWYYTQSGQFKRVSTQSAGRLFVHSDGDTDAEFRGIELVHADGTSRGSWGQSSGGNIVFRNEIDSGSLQFILNNAASTQQTMLSADPDGLFTFVADDRFRFTVDGFSDPGPAEHALEIFANGSIQMMYAGILRLHTEATGRVAVKSDTSTDTEVRELALSHQDDTVRALLGHTAGDDALQLKNQIDSGHLILTVTDAASAEVVGLTIDGDALTTLHGDTGVDITMGTSDELAIQAVVDADVKLFHNAIETARTLAVLSGGFEVDNQLTGGGFERALTTSDLTGGTPLQFTVADETTDTTCFPLFVTGATGDLGPKTAATTLTFNSNTGALFAASLTLTTDLAIADGGTAASSAGDARTNLVVDVAGTDNSTDVTLVGTPDYLTISTQAITLGLIDLTTDVTGDLPIAEGGTGASDAITALVNLGFETKFKTATNTRANNTLTDDEHMVGFTIDAATMYSFVGYLLISNPLTTADVLFRFDPTQTFVDSRIKHSARGSTANGAPVDDSGLATSSNFINLLTGDEIMAVEISGFFKTHATMAGTVDFQWSQSTTEAGNLTSMYLGSWIRIQKMGPS